MGIKSIEPTIPLSSPLLPTSNIESHAGNDDRTSSIPATLILTTLVAVFGSYAFGSVVGYSSPSQSGIMNDLNIGVAQYSIFGSILTIGAMIGAIASGKIADYAGRRVVSFTDIGYLSKHGYI